MPLLLTSQGLTTDAIHDAFTSHSPKPIGESRVAFFDTAAEPNIHEPWVEEAIADIRKSGVRSIDRLNMNVPFDERSFDNYEIVFVNGGNTFYLLKKMRDAFFQSAIVPFLERGGLYVGVSAGSIVAGPSIAVADSKTNGDPNDVGLTDFTALRLVKEATYPHFQPHQQKEVDDFQATVEYPVVALKDDEAILAVGDTAERL